MRFLGRDAMRTDPPPLLFEELPARVRTRRGIWHLRTAAYQALIDRTEAILAARAVAIPSDVRLLKYTDRRLVFRIPMPGAPDQGCVAKVVFLAGWRRRLKHRRYAETESANLITAARRGLIVPRVFGYGRMRHFLGPPSATVLLMQAIDDRRPIREILRERADDPEYLAQLLSHCIELFERLYAARLNHIDLNFGNVLPDERDPAALPMLLDFEYVDWLAQPDAGVLMFSAGRFARSCARIFGSFDYRGWAERLLDRIGVDQESHRTWLLEQFDFSRRFRLTRQQRLRPCA